MLKLYFPQREELMAKMIRKDHKVLDIGCVHNENINKISGWLHNFVRSLSDHVEGIDLDRDSVIELQNRGYVVSVADAQSFDLGKKYDCVVAGEIIEHLANFEGFLLSVKRHLNSSGVLLLSTPNCWNAFNFISVFFRGYAPVHIQHTCWFCEKTLTQLLERYGFEVVQLEHLVTPRGARFAIVSRILYALGFKKAAGSGLFVMAKVVRA